MSFTDYSDTTDYDIILPEESPYHLRNIMSQNNLEMCSRHGFNSALNGEDILKIIDHQLVEDKIFRYGTSSSCLFRKNSKQNYRFYGIPKYLRHFLRDIKFPVSDSLVTF